jgi:hypothetical protein
VGAVKTCLLNAILNNLDILNNQTDKKKLKSFEQLLMLHKINDNSRNNIVFKRNFDSEIFNIISNIFQLNPDFELILFLYFYKEYFLLVFHLFKLF